MVKMPSQKKDTVEQMSISLNVPPKQEPVQKVEVIETLPQIQDVIPPVRIDEPCGLPQNGNQGSQIEFPPFFKKEAIRKERVYVSKGSVLTQYEDDMDVPTFLRKQMQ